MTAMKKNKIMRKTLTLIFAAVAGFMSAQDFHTASSFHAAAARQAVAADSSHVYAISNRRIVKYSLQGDSVAGWTDSGSSPLTHLNSGVVKDGRLYCAHSNYPSLPMASSVEVFDTTTMQHVSSISLGIGYGSLTWVLPCGDGGWYAFFAYYDKEGARMEGRGVEWSQLVRFDSCRRAMRAWVLPEALVAKVSPNSLSGAVMQGGRFYCTGHDAGEVYVLSVPRKGSALLWEQTIAVPFAGQGIAADADGCLWGIVRKDRLVVRAVRTK